MDNDESRVIMPKKQQSVQLERLRSFAMTAEKREQYANLEFLYPGLFVKGYHHYLFGPDGAGKTTVILNICIKMVQDNPDLNVIFLYLDGTTNMASNMSKYIEDLGLSERIELLTEGTILDYKPMFLEMIKERTDLSNMFFVLDTFKFLTENINDKTANKKAMHLIKDLQRNCGVTWTSLGHTNKDKKDNSGTAEITQDCDAVLRIDGTTDEKGIQVSTITKGGRCRFDMKPVSFKFRAGDVTSVEKLNEVIDSVKLLRDEEDRKIDMDIITKLKAIMMRHHEIKQKDLLKEAKEDDGIILGQNKILAILRKYENMEWRIRVERSSRNAYYYQAIDKVGDSIAKINGKI